ncbi:MlaD family protein [Massilia sp. W12]|uniref:PqiB family protein n=1 Tax=Massilia sp. W12 TaxID=3126507 RepID=UPI0030D154B8
MSETEQPGPHSAAEAQAEPAAKMPSPAAPDLPAVTVRTRHWQWSPWIIWLIPVSAAVIALWLVIHAALDRGTIITIAFKSAEGLEAGKTKIKFKDVDIGDVKSITLSRDRTQVIVRAQLAKGASNIARDDTVFWVVKPRVGAGGISGLSTLFSGSYIAADIGKSEVEREEFTGLDAPPPLTNGLAGRHFLLHSEQIGSLDVGAPLYYRRLQVGQVVSYELDKNGRGFTFNVFVHAPYDQYVRQNTLFSHASGVELSLDANGVKLQTEALAAILAGGISFETPNSESSEAMPQAAANTEFTLFASRQKALQRPDFVVKPGLLYFQESVRGLQAGAPLDFRGIVIGDVKAVKLEYDKAGQSWRVPVEINLYPQRLHSHLQAGASLSSEELLQQLQRAGLHARLKTGNLLTGALYVALDVRQPGSDAAELRNAEQEARKIAASLPKRSDAPLVIATLPGGLEQLQAAFMRIAGKIEKLPLQETTQDVRTALASLNSGLQSADKLMRQLDKEVAPEAQKTLQQVRQSLGRLDHTLAEDGNLQLDLRDSLRELKRAAQALQQLAEQLERRPDGVLRGKQEDKK